jgi:hypothetical protein
LRERRQPCHHREPDARSLGECRGYGPRPCHRVLSKKELWNSPEGYNLEHHPLENTITNVGSGGDYGRAAGVEVGEDVWHYLAATVAGTTARVYLDGVDLTTDSTVSALVAGTQALRIGRRSGGAEHYFGSIDEVRVSSVARSADWIAAQYRSMSDTFVTFGVPHGRGPLSAETSLELHPETEVLQFETLPSGLQLLAFDEARPTPFAHEAIVNGTTTVSAPTPQVYNGRQLHFISWSDGGARTHSIVVQPGAPPLTATYGRRFRGDLR